MPQNQFGKHRTSDYYVFCHIPKDICYMFQSAESINFLSTEGKQNMYEDFKTCPAGFPTDGKESCTFHCRYLFLNH